uniref:Serpentine receptor class gamma n=1 Tax=Globodera pallida TaxID=36090 RepID=A0A183CEU3_GLOPA
MEGPQNNNHRAVGGAVGHQLQNRICTGDASYINYTFYINTVSSVIFTILCVLLNIGTFVAYKQHVNRIAINGSNTALIEKKLLIYAMATFLGHLLVASLFLITIITNIDDPETTTFLYINYPLIMDTGTVVLSSWLLLWASSTIRQQLIKDFAIIRIRNNRVGPMEGPQNNNHLAVGGVVGDKLQNRICRSAQQLPTIS